MNVIFNFDEVRASQLCLHLFSSELLRHPMYNYFDQDDLWFPLTLEPPVEEITFKIALVINKKIGNMCRNFVRIRVRENLVKETHAFESRGHQDTCQISFRRNVQPTEKTIQLINKPFNYLKKNITHRSSFLEHTNYKKQWLQQ